MHRLFPALTLGLLLLPILAGLAGTWLPAFGYLPAIGGTSLTLAPWRELFAAPGLPEALRLTIVTGLLATAISLGLVLLFCAWCHDRRWFVAARRLLPPMLALPHVAVAIGFAFLIAPSGWLVRLLSPWATGWTRPPDLALVQDPYGLALVAGLVLKEVPYLLLMALAGLGQIRADRQLAVARSLGYRPAAAWIKVLLPQLYPQLRLPVYAVLAFSLSVVDTALILAPTTPPPLAPLLLRWFTDPDLAVLPRAAAGAVLQLLLVLLLILAWHLAERLVARLSRRWLYGGGRGRRAPLLRRLAPAAVLLPFLLAGGAIVAMGLASLARSWRFPDALPHSFTLANWMQFGTVAGEPAWTTASVGLAAAGLALCLALGCLENEKRRGLHPSAGAMWLLYLPLLLPQMAFLFGMQVMLVHLGIDGRWFALVWAHLLFVLPYVFLSMAGPFRALDDRYARIALGLGASPRRIFWRIKMPLLLRPVLVALAVGFAVSVSLYLPTLFAGAGRYSTLATEAVTLASSGDRRIVGVVTFTQALMPLLAFALALFLPAWLFRNRRGLRVAQ